MYVLIYHNEQPLKKRIPLHSLVFCDSIDNLNGFLPHERLSKNSIEKDLIGDQGRLDLSTILIDELSHRINLKLSLGERVVVLANDLDASTRKSLSAIAANQGASIIELESKIDADPKVPFFEALKSNWQGVTVVGDIHGDLASLSQVICWAQSRRHFLWFLGDVIDYGSDTLKTMHLVYRTVMDGNGGMIIGNHERKIARWLDQKDNGKIHMRISDGNKVTIAALNKLNQPDRRQWIGQFRSLLAHASLLQQVDDVTLVHAAIHPSLWTTRPDEKEIERFALYGEADNFNGKFRRTHRWIDQVPKEQMVIVGHDVMHAFPVVKTGAKGGQVVFLDTGCGKAGKLSSADLKFDETGLRLECFKQHY